MRKFAMGVLVLLVATAPLAQLRVKITDSTKTSARIDGATRCDILRADFEVEEDTGNHWYCLDAATDVWTLVKTGGLKGASYYFGNEVDEDISLFFDLASTDEYLKWVEASDEFQLSNDLRLNVSGATLRLGDVDGSADTTLLFDYASDKTLHYDVLNTQFEFNDDVQVTGDFAASGDATITGNTIMLDPGIVRTGSASGYSFDAGADDYIIDCPNGNDCGMSFSGDDQTIGFHNGTVANAAIVRFVRTTPSLYFYSGAGDNNATMDFDLGLASGTQDLMQLSANAITFQQPATFNSTFNGLGGGTMEGAVTWTPGTYNDAYTQLGSVRCWDDGSVIRCKDGTPSSASDGTNIMAAKSHKFWSFASPSGGGATFYIGGFYKLNSGNSDFTSTQTIGLANSSYAAHVFVVLGAATDDTLTITVTGTSITDAGVRTTSDTDTITFTHPASANDYAETAKKFIGTVSIDHTSGTAKTGNWGLAKYWDNDNTDFTVIGLEATWLGGGNDSSADILLRHHTATGWTYNAGSTPTPPTALGSLNTDHSTEDNIDNNENGAWKRTNLNTAVSGSGSEGTLWEIQTSVANTFRSGTLQLSITN